MSCRKLVLFFLVVLVAIVSVIGYKEKFSMQLYKDLNTESCWKHIKDTFNWNLDDMEFGPKKVLLSMKKLNANTYEDDNRFYPGWDKSCVIPKEHLPIFNKDVNATEDWDLYSQKPDPNSKGYLRYTNVSENPDGYVVDLKKHDEKSFKEFLGKAYEIYDKEFFDEKKRLEDLIKYWNEQKINKQTWLKALKDEIEWNVNEYNKLVDPNSQCQRDRRELEQLINEYNTIAEINRKLKQDINNYKDAISVNNSQIDSMINVYNEFSGNNINRDQLKAMNA
jgi:hypothetical protein